MNRKIVLPALLSASLLSLAGCVSTHAEWLGTPPAHPERVAADQVRVFQKEGDLPQPYEKVAIIWVEGESTYTSNRSLVQAARRKAGFLGANAVVLGEFREPSTTAKIIAGVLDVPLHHRTEVLAVRIPTAAAPADSAAPAPSRAR
jgi:hypothetical protein